MANAAAPVAPAAAPAQWGITETYNKFVKSVSNNSFAWVNKCGINADDSLLKKIAKIFAAVVPVAISPLAGLKFVWSWTVDKVCGTSAAPAAPRAPPAAPAAVPEARVDAPREDAPREDAPREDAAEV